MTSLTHAERSRGAGLASFYVGAAIDVLLGLEFLLLGDWIATLLMPQHPTLFDVSTAALLRGLGALLLIAGADTALVARSTGRLSRLLPVIPALHWAFTGAMALALALGVGMLSGAAVVVIAALGVAAAGVAVAQSAALSRRAGFAY